MRDGSLITFFNILYPLCALLGIVTCIYKVRDLLKDPSNPALIALTLARLFPALSFLCATPLVYTAIDDATGVDNLATLLVYGLIVCNSVTAQVLLLLWTHPAGIARAKARVRVGIFASVLLAMSVLFAVSPRGGEHPIDFDVTFATTPGIAAFLSIYLIAFSVGLALSARMTWRFSASVGDKVWLRRGLRLNAVGAAFGLGYALTKAVSIVARWFGYDGLNQLNIVWAPVSASIGAVLIAVSSSLPAWGPRMEAGARAWQQYQRLRPLWDAIRLAAPSIILDSGAARWHDRWDPRDMKYRLMRRAIEVRDGMLLLRDRLDEDAGQKARGRAIADGVSESEAEAVAAAARLAPALLSSANPEAPQSRRTTEESLVRADSTENVDEEVKWLASIAQALASSPYVTASRSPDRQVERRP